MSITEAKCTACGTLYVGDPVAEPQCTKCGGIIVGVGRHAPLRVMAAPLDPMPPVPAGRNHPGAFGINRHLHVHTGIDLYAPHGSPVRAMEAGRVIRVAWFTGPAIDMPWWNDTRAVYVEGASGVINYGEIQELPTIKEDCLVEKGQILGHVLTVLRKAKGRPMSMLHVELYDHGWTDTWGEWKIGEPKPEHLKDPSRLLVTIPGTYPMLDDPYKESADLYQRLREPE